MFFFFYYYYRYKESCALNVSFQCRLAFRFIVSKAKKTAAFHHKIFQQSIGSRQESVRERETEPMRNSDAESCGFPETSLLCGSSFLPRNKKNKNKKKVIATLFSLTIQTFFSPLNSEFTSRNSVFVSTTELQLFLSEFWLSLNLKKKNVSHSSDLFFSELQVYIMQLQIINL